jgi:hypothetical protein
MLVLHTRSACNAVNRTCTVQEPRGLCNLQASPAAAPNQDSRITILFDLNGVLIRAKSAELEAKGVWQHPFEARRGVKHLLSLWPQFRLGLFTSATAKTAQNRLNLLDALLWADPKTSVRPPHLRPFRAILIMAPRFFMKRITLYAFYHTTRQSIKHLQLLHCCVVTRHETLF